MLMAVTPLTLIVTPERENTVCTQKKAMMEEKRAKR